MLSTTFYVIKSSLGYLHRRGISAIWCERLDASQVVKFSHTEQGKMAADGLAAGYICTSAGSKPEVVAVKLNGEHQ